MPVEVFEFDSFRIEVASRQLIRNGKPVTLSSRAFDVLLELIKNNGEIISQEDLINAVWGGQAVEPNNLSQAVSQIRRALDDTGKEHKYLITIPRQGFKFVLPEGSHLERISDNSSISIPSENGATDAVLRKSSVKSFGRLAAIGALILILSAAAVYFWQKKSAATISSVKTIAVLPFINFSDAADEVSGLGMADTLTTKLGSLRQISVAPTSATSKFTQKERDIFEIGRQLQADAVLDGNYRREGANLRVNVQLVDVRNRRILWSESFVESSDNVLFIHDRIAEEIAETLRLELTNDERRFLANRYTNNPEAWRLYLKARAIHTTAGGDGYVQARSLYAQAVQLDGNFALAYVGLARTYAVLHGVASPKQAYQIMRQYASKALEIDDSLSEAHHALAFALWRGDWNWRDAEIHHKRAIELTPRFKRASQIYALALIGEARFDEAHTVIDRELNEEPENPSFHWTKATIRHYSRQFDQAEKDYLSLSEKHPNNLDTRTGLFFLYFAQQRYAEAEQVIEKIKSMQTVSTENNFLLPGILYAKTGQPAKAREMIAELNKLGETKPGVFGAIALIHTALGEKDKAFEFLEKSIEEREHFGYLLRVNPLYDSLRDDPRFDKLLKKINLAS